MIITPFDVMLAMQRDCLQMFCQMGQAMVPSGRALVPSSHALQGHETEHKIDGAGEQVIRFGEERLKVGTKKLHGAETRVRRVVHSVPVERRVELNDEKIVIERRPTNGKPEIDNEEALVEREYVMIDTREIPVVTKETHLREMLVLRRERTGRVEIIHDVVRRAEPEVTQPTRAPVVVIGSNKEGHREKAKH